MSRKDTILLDTVTWDLLLDASGNIALASAPYSLAQDVASAIKTFTGDLWYNQTQGIPYFRDIFGHKPPLAILKQYMVDAALSVPGVVSAKCLITSFAGRSITGQVEFVDETGNAGKLTI